MEIIAGITLSGIPQTLDEKIFYLNAALGKLKEIKDIDLRLETCEEVTGTLCPYIFGDTCGDANFHYDISDIVFKDDKSYWGNEPYPQTMSIEKRIVLRLAKEFFEGYKNYIEELKVKNMASLSKTQAINSGQTISSTVNIGPGKVYASDVVVSGISSSLKDTTKKVDDLEDENTKLKAEIALLRDQHDLLLTMLKDKGVLD